MAIGTTSSGFAQQNDGRSARSTESDWHIVDTLNEQLLLGRPFAYKKYTLSLRNFQHLYELVQPVVAITDTVISTETVKYYFTVTLLLQPKIFV